MEHAVAGGALGHVWLGRRTQADVARARGVGLHGMAVCRARPAWVIDSAPVADDADRPRAGEEHQASWGHGAGPAAREEPARAGQRPEGPRLQDVEEADRPRERLVRHGPGALSDAELLAILLRTGTAGTHVVRVAENLLARLGGLAGLHRASRQEMQAVPGVGRVKAIELQAAFALAHRVTRLSFQDDLRVSSGADIQHLVADMASLEQEQLRVVLLTTRNRFRAIRTISMGTVHSAPVRMAEVFTPAIRENLPRMILVHNHPSGDPSPSRADLDMTRTAVRLGRELDIDVLDHLVVGLGGVVSLREGGLVEFAG